MSNVGKTETRERYIIRLATEGEGVCASPAAWTCYDLEVARLRAGELTEERRKAGFYRSEHEIVREVITREVVG